MKIPRFVRIALLALAALICLAAICFGAGWHYFHPEVQRTDGIVYGSRHGKDLAFDVLRPAKTNGLAVLVLVSGGWRSGSPGAFRAWMTAPLLRRGYTVLAVYHLSQPEATVTEIAEDIHRAVRYIRHNATRLGINGQRLGVAGGSAGGHLALLLATRGGSGTADAPDPIERESSAVQAVAIFYPPTDLLNLGPSTENTSTGGPPRSFVRAFANATNLVLWTNIGRELSPIYFVHSNLPPTLIYHGDRDTLVPLEQSQRYQVAAQNLGCTVKLVIHHGGHHGWWSMLWDIRQFARWFDLYLRRPSAEG